MRGHSQRGHKSDLLNFVMKVDLPVSTRVAIGSGAIEKIGSLLSQCEIGKRVLVICQPAVRSPWGEAIEKSISEAGFSCSILELPDGEGAKSHEQLLLLWHKLQELQFDRSDCLVAIGGGAISDVAGFAASTYLRGIKLVLVPTTLLAQVDAAIGGKTGINLAAGKNLAGSFYFPAAVVVDPDVLSTLSERDVRSGLGEIIKYTMIEKTVSDGTDYKSGPMSLFKVMSTFIMKDGFSLDNPVLPSIIAACIKIKLAVVAKDPYEQYLRRSLNLGHTLGHALEKVSGYSITHGEGVAMGLIFASNVSMSMSTFEGSELEQLTELIHAANLPTVAPLDKLDKAKIVQAMGFDKKRQGDMLKFVLPLSPIGRCSIDHEVSITALGDLL